MQTGFSGRRPRTKRGLDAQWGARGLLAHLTDAGRGGRYLMILLVATYVLAPLAVASQLDAPQHFIELATVSSLATLCVWLGARTRWFDATLLGRGPGVVMDPTGFIAVVWSVFVVFVFTSWATADEIPLLAVFRGTDADTIAVLREQFLKAREGWQASFVYINAVLSGALIPYSIALMFLLRLRGRWLAFGFFLLFCISFVEKAFFMKAALPLLYLVAQRQVKVPVRPTTLLWGMVGLLMLVTALSGAGSADVASDDAFFSVTYAPQGALQHLFWRSMAIPLLTAVDAIRVLNEDFGGRMLWGSTSTLLAVIFGQERIEFERLVFAAQWGQNETGTGSSNSVYLTEAYVNFGWVGVAIFSWLIGLLMRLFARTRDVAARSLWPLFVLGVYTSGLIGLMLSNGFLLFFILVLFARFRQTKRLTRSPRMRFARLSGRDIRPG